MINRENPAQLSWRWIINPLYWPIWLIIGLLWLITRLPLTLQYKIGQMLGVLLYLFPSRLKQITMTNLALCFPELSLKERQRLAKKNFASVGIGLIEAAIAWWLPDEKLTALWQLHGLEYAELALARGKGIILLSPHFTSLELVGRLIGMKYAFGVMYRPHKKSFIAYFHERFRKKHYVNYIPSNKVRQLLHALQSNMAIWYAYDIDAGAKHSVFAPFFGMQTASLTTVSRLVRLSDATVIPIAFYRRENELSYDVYLFPPLTDFPTGDDQADATLLNQQLERAIRQKPEQYVWQYKRFKTRPAGEKRFY